MNGVSPASDSSGHSPIEAFFFFSVCRSRQAGSGRQRLRAADPLLADDLSSSRKGQASHAVVPFEQTCTPAISTNRRQGAVSGPKGVAFLTLPGLDLQTLKKKKASIGEWPDSLKPGSRRS